MAFINNQLIGSIAGAIGLGHIIPGADPAVAAGHSPQNNPSYKDRPYTPRNMSLPDPSARGAVGSGTPVAPGEMDPSDQNNPTVADLLNHFGVHPLQQVDPHLFIHNAQAWANHPIMSGVLDGLLSGAANTKSGDTIGENISNVAQGIAATHAQQAAQVNTQIQAPMQQAMQVAQLQDEVGKQKLNSAQVDETAARGKYYNDYWPQHLADIQQPGANQLARTQAQSAAKIDQLRARPVGMDQQTYDAHIAAAKDRLGLDPGQDPTPEQMQAITAEASKAIAEIKQDPKTKSAIQIAAATLPGKINLKGAIPGVNPASGGAGGRTSDYNKALLRQAATEYNKRATMDSGRIAQEYGVFVSNEAERQAFLKPYADNLARATAAMSGAPQSAAAPAPNRNNPSNPYAQTKNK
jgi:hypothetical protein